MKIKERIQAVQQLMEKEKMDAYYIATADFHQSEYVADYFKVRQYMTGFTGSAGTLVITPKEAVLWVDGRYFTQADKELKGTGIKAYKMRQPKVPTVMQYLVDVLPEKGCLGFDGNVVSTQTVSMFKQVLNDKKIKIKTKDLISDLWTDRPALPSGQCFLLPDKYTGMKMEKKIARLREDLKKQGQESILLSALEDVAWLLNLRGNDIKHTPVTLSYILLTQKKITLYIDKKKFSSVILNRLKKAKVVIKPYHAVSNDLKELKENSLVIDPRSLNATLRLSIASSCKVIEKTSPVLLYRAMKNKTEIKSIKNALLKDGVALTKFIHWVKSDVGKYEISEVDAERKLNDYRAQMEGFIEPSFSTIAAYGENAAMMHYSATEKSHSLLKKEGFFLVDSGGQYLDGTTDVTRTIVLGNVSEKAKTYYTAVLRGMIRLSKANFLYGCNGSDLDLLARGPVWDLDLDYQCGTGHGIGFCLGVHEGPQNLRWGQKNAVAFEEGMVVTNEPGIYLPQELGIRIENELVVRKGKNNHYGQFMNFETVTLAPIDLDAINPQEMMQDEIEFLNQYHEMVYKKLSPYMTPKEKTWLKIQTRRIQK